MRKVKNVLVILLALLLLASGSLLPMGAAYRQDKTTANVVQYADMEALQLTLEEEAPSMTFPEKLLLLMHGVGVDITDEKTRIKEEEILEATYTALTPYMELYFGKGLDNDYLEYYPVMVYDENDPSRFCYYWHVVLSLDASLEDHTSVILDDETGKLLAVEMTDPDFNIDDAYLQELQYAVAVTYFGELGIDSDAAWQQAVEEGRPYDTCNVGIVTIYQSSDILYVEVNLEIYVHTDGLFIYVV